jgi:hypothetical protein
MVAVANGGNSQAQQLREGVYEVGHFGCSNFLRGYEEYPETTVGPYGVCDNLEQLLTACPELESSERQFVVTLTRVRKADQPPDGGWRWHKWGEYIGTQDRQCEYLHDEPHVDEVFCFHIYEKMAG